MSGSFRTSLTVLALLSSPLVACGDDSSTGGGPAGGGSEGGGGAAATGGGGAGGSGTEAICTDPVAVPCEDAVFLQMNLQDTLAPDAAIDNTPEGTGFLTHIDATAGGAFATTPDSYTYGKFTDDGIELVSISDEASLTSMDWDIAFRRYVSRINSGNSGPSCVAAARLPGTPDFDTVDAAPADAVFRTDDYFTDSCELIADGTGLEGSPATALSSYWTYPGCVQMSGNVFIVRLADGRTLKLTVTAFYNDDVQAQCDETGTIPMQNTGSGNIKLRWAFL